MLNEKCFMLYTNERGLEEANESPHLNVTNLKSKQYNLRATSAVGGFSCLLPRECAFFKKGRNSSG